MCPESSAGTSWGAWPLLVPGYAGRRLRVRLVAQDVLDAVEVTVGLLQRGSQRDHLADRGHKTRHKGLERDEHPDRQGPGHHLERPDAEDRGGGERGQHRRDGGEDLAVVAKGLLGVLQLRLEPRPAGEEVRLAACGL